MTTSWLPVEVTTNHEEKLATDAENACRCMQMHTINNNVKHWHKYKSNTTQLLWSMAFIDYNISTRNVLRLY